MKRFLPFIIIVFVGLVTVGSAALFYRSKMEAPQKPASTPVPAPVAAARSAPSATASPEAENQNPSLHIRGPRSAPVTMEVYGDFQCPSCGHFSVLVKELEKQYGDRLRVIFYEFPLAMHNHALEAARAAEAAGLQGKFWEMHDQLYQYQDVWSRVGSVGFFFDNYAEAIGLDVARFRADRQSADVQQMVIAQGAEGTARGVQNTPTIFVNGTMVRSIFSREKLQEAIDQALAAKGKS